MAYHERQADQALFERLVPFYHKAPQDDVYKYKIFEKYRDQGLDWGAAMHAALLDLAALETDQLLDGSQEYEDALIGQEIYRKIQED